MLLDGDCLLQRLFIKKYLKLFNKMHLDQAYG